MSTQLSDERIDRMRESVLTTLDADVARRGRRARRALGTLAAACFVVAIGGVGFATLVAPIDGSDRAGSAADLGFGGTSQDSASTEEAARDSAGAEADLAPGATAQQAEPPERTTVDPDRSVVVTGSATVVVASPTRTADLLAAWVAGRGGRLDQRTELSGSDAGRDTASASLVVRVPAADVDRTVAQLREYGDVTSVDVAREDVTTSVADLDARVRSLRTSIERLDEILAEADDAGELLAVERSLAERQGELESLQAQRKALGDRVALSTISVELVAKDGAEKVDPGGFVGGLEKGWNGLVSTVNGAVSLLGTLLPWLGVGLVAWLLWRGVRLVRTR